jgi:hypothetical protein
VELAPLKSGSGVVDRVSARRTGSTDVGGDRKEVKGSKHLGREQEEERDCLSSPSAEGPRGEWEGVAMDSPRLKYH